MTDLKARLQDMLDLPEKIGIPRKKDAVIGLLPKTVQEIIDELERLKKEGDWRAALEDALAEQRK